MRLLYVADGRSPIALNWIGYFIHAGHEVHLASTFPCQPVGGLASLLVLPTSFGGLSGDLESVGSRNIIRRMIPVKLRTLVRQLVEPLSFSQATEALREYIDKIQPDLVHAMRIPFEGMIAAKALEGKFNKGDREKKLPFLLSVWGNDFTLHAHSTPTMLSHTCRALRVADGLHTDCQRDQRLAVELGYDSTKPSIVLPGGGGVRLDVFYPSEDQNDESLTIINPRGFRAYVRNDTFFRAIPLVLEKFPRVHFVCPGMQGEAQAQRWIRELGIDGKVDLLPFQSPSQMAGLFRRSQITVSITEHDGTPNTLLEAMACGCFPIAGDMESLREWITPDENGLLVDPGDHAALAEALLHAVSHPELRGQARRHNLQLVQERADYREVMTKAEEFYRQLIG